LTDGSQHYRCNHYVPQWYQRRFMLPGQTKYFRLDLKPEVVRNWNEKKQQHITYTRKDLHHWSPEGVFAEDDLYTTQWGTVTNTDIEKFFFGELDNSAPDAVDQMANFQHTRWNNEYFDTFIRNMSVQKLRTPKGLAELSRMAKSNNRQLDLLLLQDVQKIYCATWTECVWTIASAANSPTKFIISDHPVTVYNRACPPLSEVCRNAGDPDIRMTATHTYMPLSLDKVLILTNLSWARDPYQKETRPRPNARYFGTAMFNRNEIQIDRFLTEDEVLQINHVTKLRAQRYIAGADKEWLYPERRVSTDHWKKLGGGYLFLPEPRLLHIGGQFIIGYKDGSSDGFSEYGHKPWQSGYSDEEREKRESRSLDRFQAEWAMLKGPQYTARDNQFGGSITCDDEETTEWRKSVSNQYSRKRRGRR